MDLKTINVSVTSDIGNIEGTALDLVVQLREAALSDTMNMIEQELSIDSGEFEDTEEEYYEDSFFEDDDEENEGFERQPLAEIADLPETSDEDEDVDYSELYNTTIGKNMAKYSNVISAYDDIIKTNGIVDDTVTVTYIVNKFKELSGIFNTYGDFVISTSFTTV
ncbi:hypothetical protein [Mammaliicoccus lentus]|uniref:hypothetical protein n=1 Tax=Mammaliicoccus lentus TaxID=42858 RepID=UPI001072DE99|nr:hypothetical protein [Mammaliicoccus lentus]MBF0793382.1 hypothetical protein [Mammaliicoccus lentus]TFV17883.1 hypothetical protein E4T78_01865 [Mammaliicoccus lentus]